MPTYQYKCTACDYRFEEFQSMSAKPIKICPKCGGKTERIISGGAGFLFKGSGFYITENRSTSYKKAAAKDNTPSISSTPSSTKPEKKESDNKTAKKSA